MVHLCYYTLSFLPYTRRTSYQVTMNVIVSSALESGYLGDAHLGALQRAWEDVLSPLTHRYIHILRDNVDTADRRTPVLAWRFFRLASTPPNLYMRNWEFPRHTSMLLLRHPDSQFYRLSDIWDVSGGASVEAEAVSNDLLMGPAGSHSFLHVDAPLPFSVRMAVIYGLKLVCWCFVRARDIPARIRTLSSEGGEPALTRAEYDATAEFCLANGGVSVTLHPGKRHVVFFVG